MSIVQTRMAARPFGAGRPSESLLVSLAGGRNEAARKMNDGPRNVVQQRTGVTRLVYLLGATSLLYAYYLSLSQAQLIVRGSSSSLSSPSWAPSLQPAAGNGPSQRRRSGARIEETRSQLLHQHHHLYDHHQQQSPAANSQQARAARNSSAAHLGSWHFPRISPEQAAEVIMTGAQVINRIAQAETPLNYCRTPDNQEGECSDIRKCIWLLLDKNRLKQSVCLRNLIIPAVCCPSSSGNNTPIANMIQQTLEPVLFRPKAPKAKKVSSAVVPPPLRPFASIVNKTLVGQPPPSPASLIIRNQPPSASSPTTNLTLTPLNSWPWSVANNISAPLAAILDQSSTPILNVTSSSSTQSSSVNITTTTTNSPPVNQLFQDQDSRPAYNRTVSQKYPWANETCGESGRTRTSRIVGGSDSKLGQWPWMTAMYLNKKSAFSSSTSGEFWCGGALINRRFILTAAHCLSDQRGNRYKNDQVTIKLGGVDLVRHQAPQDILQNGQLESRSDPNNFAGGHSTLASHENNRARSEDDSEEFSWTTFISKALGLNLSSSSSSSGSHSDKADKADLSDSKKQQLAAHAKKTYFKEYRVASIKQHPKFQRHGFYNDIGLIELKSEVDYDDLISPICLPTEFDLKRDLSSYMATVLGWGTLSYGGQGSKLLQQVAMPIWNNKDCDERYLQHIGKTFLCAGYLNGGKDACQGDSGGPLMVSDQAGRWTLHGLVSFGKTCAQAGYPGVYTRVTEYLDWIRDNSELKSTS